MIKSTIHAQSNSAHMGNAEYVLAPDVVLLCLEDGTGRLLAMNSYFYGLSPMATTMLAETLAAGIEATAQHIADTYKVNLPIIVHDLRALLRDLEKRRIICRPERFSSFYSSGRRLSATILRWGLHCIHSWPMSLSAKVQAILTLAYCSIRIFGWPATVNVWHDFSHTHMPLRESVDAKMIGKMVEHGASNHLLPVACKERSLSCWSLLHMAGIPARLIVGVHLFPLASHCWCSSGQVILGDEEEKCQSFTPILSYE